MPSPAPPHINHVENVWPIIKRGVYANEKKSKRSQRITKNLSKQCYRRKVNKINV